MVEPHEQGFDTVQHQQHVALQDTLTFVPA